MAGEQSKTEKPTPRRLREARKEGQFPRSHDPATWVGIAAAMAVLPLTASATTDRFRRALALIPTTAADPSPARALHALAAVPTAVIVSCGPMCAAAAVGALLATAAQGVHPSAAVLKPKFSRLKPTQGLRRMVGPHAAWEALKAFVKMLVLALVVYLTGHSLVTDLAGRGIVPLATTLDRARHGLETTVWAASAVGLLLALGDYGYQRHSVMKKLRMSRQEIKDELKQTEGDPAVKGAIRSRQLAISRNRMLSAVREADVVLVNPTHLAIALRYEPLRGAPRVVAKGAGALAAKIRKVAHEHRVPVVEDKALARALYRVCDLDDEIPSELYVAVARILAFVMAAGRPGRNAGVRRPLHSIPVPRVPSRGDLRSRRRQELRTARENKARAHRQG